jgi:putative transposase
MFVDSALRRTCAVIGAKLTHSQAGRPQGRGKIERFFRTVRDQFLVEITDAITVSVGTGTPVASLAELNSLFDAWLHQVYHQRVHSETDQAPLQRFLAHGAPAPVPGDILTEAFRWSEWRTVTATAQVNLHGNLYDVDPSLVGVRVELVFDPSDLDHIDVRVHSRSYGQATPSRLHRHVHPKADPKAGDAPTPPPVPTGIDYLRLIEARHTHSLNTRLNYAHLATPAATAAADPSPTAPTPAAADSPADTPAGSAAGSAADNEDWCYETDLVALATLADPAGTGGDPTAVPDPAPDCELAESAALPTHHHDTSADAEPGAECGRPQVAS